MKHWETSLVRILAQKESGTKDDGKPGDNGTAFGRYQIRQAAVTDVNRVHGTNYRAEDCHGNAELSQWIAERYLDMYAKESRLGHKPTHEDFARIWNGGPKGCFNDGRIDKDGNTFKDPEKHAKLVRLQANTKGYWLDFRRRLEAEG